MAPSFAAKKRFTLLVVRVVGNSAQDDEFRVELLNVGVRGALVKNLAEVCAPAAKSSIIRALRLELVPK